MVCFCYFCKKIVFCFGCGPYRPLFCESWAQKWQVLEVLPIFFRTARLQLKLLILIESPNIFIGNQEKKQSGCGLGAKFGPN